MMAIAFACQACGKRYSVKDELAGKRVKCATCGALMQLPESKPAAAPVSPAAKPPGANTTSVKSPSSPAASKAGGEYELDASPPVSADRGGPPVMAGHILQPRIDPRQVDDFELEPPHEVTAEIDLFLDDAAPPAASAGAAGAKKVKPSPPKSSSLPSADDLVVADDGEPAPAPEPTKPCPACGEAMKLAAVLCIHCGLDLRTGEKLEGATGKKSPLGKLFGGLRREK